MSAIWIAFAIFAVIGWLTTLADSAYKRRRRGYLEVLGAVLMCLTAGAGIALSITIFYVLVYGR